MDIPQDRVHLVVERADGARVLRLPAPRWLVSLLLAGVGIGLVVLGAAWGDYRALARQRASFASVGAQLAEQQAVIDGFQERLGRVRAEIETWRALHASIWEPFGPAPARSSRNVGRGGGTALRLLEVPDERGDVLDEMDRLAAVVTEEGKSLRALERFITRAGRALASLPSRWPVRGPVNSEFGGRESPWAGGGREFHSGLDIGAAQGTPVTAPAPGTVVFAGHHAEYGVALVIDHGSDIKTLYGHLTRVTVGRDQEVRRGDVVALTGNTGRSSGPHLHYEIQVRGQAVDPRSYIWE